MNYENRVVCFLDILGFQKHVNETITHDGNEDLDRTARLITAFEGYSPIYNWSDK